MNLCMKREILILYTISCLNNFHPAWLLVDFVLSGWRKVNHCHLHRISPSVEIPQNCHFSAQWNLKLSLGNLYPWRGKRHSHSFLWAKRWGRHSLPILDRHMGMKVMTGLHLHLRMFHHILWTAPGYCTQFGTLFYLSHCQNGIWNEYKTVIEFVIKWFCQKIVLTSSTVGSGLIG